MNISRTQQKSFLTDLQIFDRVLLDCKKKKRKRFAELLAYHSIKAEEKATKVFKVINVASWLCACLCVPCCIQCILCLSYAEAEDEIMRIMKIMGILHDGEAIEILENAVKVLKKYPNSLLDDIHTEVNPLSFDYEYTKHTQPIFGFLEKYNMQRLEKYQLIAAYPFLCCDTCSIRMSPSIIGEVRTAMSKAYPRT